MPRCPYQDGNHYPCGVMSGDHGSEACQFYNVCLGLERDREARLTKVVPISKDERKVKDELPEK